MKVAVLGGGPSGAFTAEKLASAGIETIVVMALIVLLSPVLLLATVRAARQFELGRIGPTPGERRSAS